MPSIATKSFPQVDFDMHPRPPFQNLSFGLKMPSRNIMVNNPLTLLIDDQKLWAKELSTKVRPLWHFKQVSMSNMIIS